MQYLLISDTHLAAGNYDPKFCDRLLKLIEEYPRVIIMGDFFDAYLSTFDAFLRSGWKRLFPALLKKKAIYIYGNHDRPEFMNELTTEFSVEQTYRKVLEVEDVLITLQHGHLYAPDFDGKFPWFSYYLSWLYPRYHRHASEQTWLNRLFLKAYNDNKNKLLHADMKRAITRFKEKNKDMRDNWQITGHSHIQEVDYKLRYINIGATLSKSLEYVVIDTSGTMLVVKDSHVQTVAVV